MSGHVMYYHLFNAIQLLVIISAALYSVAAHFYRSINVAFCFRENEEIKLLVPLVTGYLLML